MKLRFLFLSLLWFTASGLALGQDKLLDRNGNEYLVKVLEITPDSVIYKPFPDSASINTYVIPKAAVFMITYQNGVKDVFLENLPEPEVQAVALDKDALYNLGKTDAIKYFKPRGAYWGTLGATLLYPPVGLGVGAVIAATPPSRHNMETNNVTLLDNPHYTEGYKQQAKKKKLGKAAAGLGTAVGIYAAFFILIIAAFVQ
ncbi:hypothetical protein I5M27_15240 [Adhaeribacter sp. BT258]|uniref:PEGA domain-containing protein n=1 Tax=Adhaeribacter terrigena TaxID=2793070 RepID=A0ABS1C4M8_9BACT|nr:hypothetical protein [Adhaeribacter terrigena]MBK0404351.1 hypothetical protein [Adhaeribacter terrigena]